MRTKIRNHWKIPLLLIRECNKKLHHKAFSLTEYRKNVIQKKIEFPKNKSRESKITDFIQ